MKSISSFLKDSITSYLLKFLDAAKKFIGSKHVGGRGSIHLTSADLFLKRSFRQCCNFGQHYVELKLPLDGSKKSIFCEAPHSGELSFPCVLMMHYTVFVEGEEGGMGGEGVFELYPPFLSP